jgi:hypothetical protein
MGMDVIKAQWAVRITGFRPVPEFATAGEGSRLLNPVMLSLSCGSLTELGNDY